MGEGAAKEQDNTIHKFSDIALLELNLCTVWIRWLPEILWIYRL